MRVLRCRNSRHYRTLIFVMTLPFRLICSAALLFVASAASAANVVPGLEVVALKGSSTVFKGITDGRGRFETGPLEPGIYTIEVRIAKGMPPTSARYFLALAGAKPLGNAMIRPGVALAIGAQVRTSAGIRGQVSARGVVYVPAPSSSPASGNRSAATANVPTPAANAIALRTSAPGPSPGPVASNRPATANPPVASARTRTGARTGAVASPTAISTVVSPQAAVAARPIGNQPKIINGRPSPAPAGSRATIANASAPASNAIALRTPTPGPSTGPVARLAPLNRPASANPPVAFARTQAVARTIPAPPVKYPPKIIDGRRYFWVPIAPGSNLGRWMPESVSRPAINAPRSSNARAPQASPRPSPTPHR